MEWKEELNTSPEVKRAKLDLDYHRKKVRERERYSVVFGQLYMHMALEFQINTDEFT